jgi:hypothetical protein
MNLVDALLDIGAESKEVLNDLPGGAALTALEVVRHAACTGAQSILQDPPPVLYHESKIPSTSLLYASQLPLPVQQGPHRHVTADEIRGQYAGEGVVCVGGLMMDVTQCDSVPVCIVVQRCEEKREVAVFVDAYEVPVARMEAELFSDKPAGAFERKWLDDLAQDAITFRSGTGKFIQSKGYNQMPGWLWSGEYMSQRDGPLPLLRLRGPTKSETPEVEKLVSVVATHCHSGITTLKNILESSFRSDDDCSVEDWKFRVSTRFFASGVPAPSDPTAPAVDLSKFPTMGILSLLLIKSVNDTDYYDVAAELMEESQQSQQAPEGAAGARGREQGPSCENDQGMDPNDPLANLGASDAIDSRDHSAVLRTAIGLSEREQMLFGERRAKRTQGTDGGARAWMRSDRGAMAIAERTGRQCGTTHLQRSASALARAKAMCKQAFEEDEYDFLAHCLDRESSADQAAPPVEAFDALLESIGLALDNRFAILAIHQNGDGGVTKCTLAAHNGCSSVTLDCAERLLLVSWAYPVVIKANEAATVQVAGVGRETLRLTADKAQEARRWRIHPGEEALEALRKLPELLQQLGGLPGTGGLSAPPGPCYADAGRGFKRAKACLQEYRLSMDQCANGGA